MWIHHLSRVALLLTLFASGILSEAESSVMSKNDGPRDNVVRDSPLERLQFKQETGFDGRVRSIRFNFEPEQDVLNDRNKQRLSSQNNVIFHPIRSAYNQNIGLPTRKMLEIDAASRELSHFESTTRKTSRSKRRTEKHLAAFNEDDDLETAEAKVFRPLFVYRQQVSRRLKLQKDRQSNNNHRQIRSHARPRYNSYYYPPYYNPYQYAPYANTYFF